jgi:2,3-dihydroxyphenylpropionate 1,2-dioxygenase
MVPALAACCLSHSPLRGVVDPETEALGEIHAIEDDLRAFVAAFDPELVVLFAPDHLNGFVYRVMPQFCVGLAAEAIGDFGSPRGALDVPEDLARACAAAVLRRGVDVAVSLRMEVDHGFAQPLALLTGALAARSTIPVFVNAAGPPRAPMARSRMLGRAVGEWAAESGLRVLVIGSGGLAHDPPTPVLERASPAVRERLTEGIAPAMRAEREASVADLARDFVAGTAPLRPLDGEFDTGFVDLIADGRLEAVDGWDDDQLTERHGRAVHEVRTWVAALSALAVGGPYEVVHRHTRPVPQWIVGYGALAARPVGPKGEQVHG